jgi:hypothetical protein
MRDRYLAFIAVTGAQELVFAGLAIVFVIVGFTDDSPLANGLEFGLTAVFVAEFTSRLAASHDRGRLRGHWIDAIALIPTVGRPAPSPASAPSTGPRRRRCPGADDRRANGAPPWPRPALTAWSADDPLLARARAAENGVNAAVTSPLDARSGGGSRP